MNKLIKKEKDKNINKIFFNLLNETFDIDFILNEKFRKYFNYKERYINSCKKNIVDKLRFIFLSIIYEEYNEKFKITKNARETYSYLCTDEFSNSINKKYPILKEKVSKIIHNEIYLFLYVLEKYIDDKDKIEKDMSLKLGELVNIETGIGDIHNGKSTCKVLTENATIYFKPNSGTHINFLYDIFDIVFDSLKEDIDYYKIKYCNCDSHHWVNEVKESDCENYNDIKHYLKSSGVFLSIFYSLSSFDMHFENIINNGKYPIVIDFETLSMQKGNSKDISTKFRAPIDSIFNTAFIPFISENGAYDYNLSGILSKEATSDFIKSTYYEIDQELNIVKKETNHIRNNGNPLKLNGKDILDGIVSLDEVYDFISNGFICGCISIIQNKSKIINLIEEKYINCSNIKFRQILRPTQVYHTFKQTLLTPYALESESVQNKILTILNKNFKPSKFGYLRLEKEISDLKNGDIPVFYSLINDKSLYSGDEVICEEYFNETIYERIKNKVYSLDEETINYQLRLLKLSMCILTVEKDFGQSFIVNNKGIHNNNTDLSTLNIIENYNEYLLSHTYPILDNFLSKITLHLNPKGIQRNSMWKIEDIIPSIYEDGGHFILPLLYSFRKHDKKLFHESIKIIKYLNLHNIDINKDSSIFSSNTGLLYINHLVLKLMKINNNNELINFKKLVNENITTITKQFSYKSLEDIKFDYLSGECGVIYFLAKIYNEIEDPILKNDVFELIERIDNYIVKTNKILNNEVGMAHGISGVLLMISEIYKITKNKNLLVKIKKMSIVENELIDNVTFCKLSNSWCRGKFGIFLARKYVWRNIYSMKSNQSMIQEIQNDLLKYNINIEIYNNDVWNCDNLGLCHGVLGNIAIANDINNRYHIKSKDIIEKFNITSLTNISWLSNFKMDYDGFMAGNSGVAYSLLQLDDEFYPNIFLLDIPNLRS